MASFFGKFIDYRRNGPGVKKSGQKVYTFSEFWRIYKEKFFKLLAINLMYFACLVLVALICYFPINKVISKENHFSNKLKSYNLSAGYVTLINNYYKTYNISDDLINESIPHFEAALNKIKEINPSILTNGYEELDITAYSDEDKEIIFSEFKAAFNKLGFELDNNNEQSTAGLSVYTLTDSNGTQTAQISLSDKNLQIENFFSGVFFDLIKILVCLIPLILLSPINLAFTRITRDYVQEAPSFMFHDIWDTIKKNWWQSGVIGLFQYFGASVLVLGLNWYYSYFNSGMFFKIGFFICLFMVYVYLSMNFYLGLMQVTLDMNLRKIFKNAFYFSVICLWKNLLTILVIALLLFVFFILLIVGMAQSLVMSLTFTAIMIFLFGFIFYFVTFMTYPSVRKFVIDPYYAEIKAKAQEKSEAEDDTGADNECDEQSESEYVYHNGRMVHRSVLEQENLFKDENFDE